MKRMRWTGVVSALAVVAFALTACGGGDDSKVVNVLGVWGGGDELGSFQAAVEPWEEDTGPAQFAGRLQHYLLRLVPQLLSPAVHEVLDPCDDVRICQ